MLSYCEQSELLLTENKKIDIKNDMSPTVQMKDSVILAK